MTYSQDREDLILDGLLKGKSSITYLDIGAGDPQIINNTFFFYQKGCSGVLVDPLPWNCQEIKKKRPRDMLLEGVVYNGPEKEVWIRVRGRHGGGSRIVKERPPEDKRQVLAKVFEINDILIYLRKVPDFISIDAEGHDLQILKSLDFNKSKVPLFCVETEHDKEIVPFLKSKGYEVAATTRSNTIFKTLSPTV